MSNFQSLEVVDRGSETQSQVVENWNKLTLQDKGQLGVSSAHVGLSSLTIYRWDI